MNYFGVGTEISGTNFIKYRCSCGSLLLSLSLCLCLSLSTHTLTGASVCFSLSLSLSHTHTHSHTHTNTRILSRHCGYNFESAVTVKTLFGNPTEWSSKSKWKIGRISSNECEREMIKNLQIFLNFTYWPPFLVLLGTPVDSRSRGWVGVVAKS